MSIKEFFTISPFSTSRSWYAMSLLLMVSYNLLFSYPALAQKGNNNSPKFNAFFEVRVKSKDGKDLNESVVYANFEKYSDALDAQNRFKKAITEFDQGLREEPIPNTIDELKGKYKDVKFKKNNTGSFGIRCRKGEAVLYIVADKFVKIFSIEEGKTEYTDIIVDERNIGEIIATGKIKIKLPPAPPPIDADTMYFTFPVRLPAGTVKENSRLTVQMAIVNCNTEDTVAYLTPHVFEGEDYHSKQDRRMAFDYNTNDSMFVGYERSNVLRSNTPFICNVKGKFCKPQDQKKHLFKAANFVVVDDYHSTTYDTLITSGSCLALTPCKFLDFSVATKDMQLTEQFKEEAGEMIDSVARNLKLKFVVGSDKLTEDSLNLIELNKLIGELKSYGRLLETVMVRGGASPEGRLETNIKLAKKRQLTASKLISNNVSAYITQGEPVVFTWDDVVKSINKRNDVDQSTKELISNIVANSKPENVFGQLKKMPFYDNVIEPALENLRIMQVTYSYAREYIMDADEAVTKYYENKADLLSGKLTFSAGDFYNLYSQITDSAELDTITTIAYKTITSKPNYHRIPIAPYVCNKMSLLKFKRGEAPDLEILSLFIDSTRPINYEERADNNVNVIKFVYNRPEIFLNQAITYFSVDSLDTSYKYAELLKRPDLTTQLQNFINFRRYYPLGVQNQIEDEKTKKLYETALDYVLSSDYNKAIIFSELKIYFKKDFHYVDSLIDMMDDGNPKKWYLKGILWEQRADSSQTISLNNNETFEILTTDELTKLTKEEQEEYHKKYKAYLEGNLPEENGQKDKEEKPIPYFLAFFQHSFDLDRELKRWYFREGNVNEERRKSHPYKKKDIQKYRDLFQAIIKDRDAKKKAAVPMAQSDSEYDDEEISNNNGSVDGDASTNIKPTEQDNRED